MTEKRLNLLALMFCSIPQGASELFSSDDEVADFCIGTIAKKDLQKALNEIQFMSSLKGADQLDFFNSLDSEVFIRSSDQAVNFTNLLRAKLQEKFC